MNEQHAGRSSQGQEAGPDAEGVDHPAAPRRSGLLDPLLDSSRGGLLGGLSEADANDDSDRPGRSDDRWAHRRGEPRVFALMLSLYLLGGAMLTIFAKPMIGAPGATAFVQAAKTLLILVAVAVAALWPMTRLSQAPPRRPVAAALSDLVIVTLLVQAVVWPATILPGGSLIKPAPWLGLWPWSVTAGLVLLFASWSALVGGIIACGAGGSAGPARTGWMLIVLLVTAGGPLIVAVTTRFGLPAPDGWRLWSLLTAAPEFVHSQSGLVPRMSAGEWLAASAPILISAPWWLLSVWRARRRADQSRSSASVTAP